MPVQAYALVVIFASISLAAGWFAWKAVAAVGGPAAVRWAAPPIVVAFLAFYVIGHRLGLAVGPEVGLFGYRIALIGDTAIGTAAAAGTAIAQWAVVRALGSARRRHTA